MKQISFPIHMSLTNSSNMLYLYPSDFPDCREDKQSQPHNPNPHIQEPVTPTKHSVQIRKFSLGQQ